MAQVPISATLAVSPCPINDAPAGLVCSSLQLCPAQPLVLQRLAYPRAHIPARPQAVLIPREVPDARFPMTGAALVPPSVLLLAVEDRAAESVNHLLKKSVM